MLKHKFLFFIIFLMLPSAIWAQSYESYSYSRETKWGINKNTSGGLIGGIIIKHSRGITDRIFQTFGVELVNITHPNEVRYPSATGNFFKYGKENYLYSIRTQYGRDVVLFKKAPQKGAQIIAMMAGGPSFGFITPYYIDVGNSPEPYDPEKPSHQTGPIFGTGRVFQGLAKNGLNLGVNLKAGFSFEFGVFKNNVTGFEIGVLLDVYTEKVQIMDGTDPVNIFPTSFLTLFWGARK